MPKASTPVIKGYAAVRGDRKGAAFPGGGLIIYIKDDIVFKSNGHCQRDAVELLSISVQRKSKKWLTINNMYIPPKAEMDLSWIPIKGDTIIAGDFNGHSRLWDDHQPCDSRGEKIIDWMLEKDLTCINDGSHTRVNRGTGGLSTPDTTFVTTGLNTKSKWSAIDETDMDSDHLPIVVEIKKSDIQTISTMPFRTRWKTKNVDWDAFREEIEERIVNVGEFDSLRLRVETFNEILREAGNKHVGKTKPSKTKFAMNPKVKALVNKRNKLRKEVKTKRKEWLEAAAEARLARAEAKETAWTEFVEALEVDDDVTKVWRTIKSLDNTSTSSAPNEALSHNGKTVTTNKAKADVFAKHYAKVSSLSFNKRERDEIRETKKKLYSHGPDLECPPFTMQELKAAIRKMKRKGAPGDDNIPPSFLKELGPKARQELLSICNLSFLEADIPQMWRHGIIIPLLKHGKPASELESYRPISLTSCVVKLLERMISNRLYTMAERNGWICNQQAGFRKHRSTEDQVIKLIQKISDGFQKKPHSLRTVMVLLDYSKAYDRTWKERLLKKIHDLGTPRTITKLLPSCAHEQQK